MFTYAEIQCRHLGPAVQCLFLFLFLSWFDSLLLRVPLLCFHSHCCCYDMNFPQGINKGLSICVCKL